ncbi:hypothetical protein [Kroppenstedtia sanguinis]|uniref:Uncharacterized protein n=1 Tax=Kroppenstedtia sanguinis TaxID=1380684 RepID=A0ABW4CEA3_9BACL
MINRKMGGGRESCAAKATFALWALQFEVKDAPQALQFEVKDAPQALQFEVKDVPQALQSR